MEGRDSDGAWFPTIGRGALPQSRGTDRERALVAGEAGSTRAGQDGPSAKSTCSSGVSEGDRSPAGGDVPVRAIVGTEVAAESVLLLAWIVPA